MLESSSRSVVIQVNQTEGGVKREYNRTNQKQCHLPHSKIHQKKLGYIMYHTLLYPYPSSSITPTKKWRMMKYILENDEVYTGVLWTVLLWGLEIWKERASVGKECPVATLVLKFTCLDLSNTAFHMEAGSSTYTEAEHSIQCEGNKAVRAIKLSLPIWHLSFHFGL